MTATKRCPCGRNRPYERCCGPLLDGTAHAPTAERLMRSRYTAFCTGHVDYLIATLHPSKQHDGDRATLAQGIAQRRWLRLQILDRRQGRREDDEGWVEFVAYYEEASLGQLHERSRFVREGGRWFYVDGEHLGPVKTGRNDPCGCSSGKKYKKCHGR